MALRILFLVVMNMESGKNMYRYTASQDRLKQWIEDVNKYLGTSPNEADTRAKIIDPLFVDVLGWDEKQIQREGYISKIGYSDYKLDSGTNRIIIEAKKEFVPFVMPKTLTVKYYALKDEAKDLYNAIEQGIDYAAPRNSKIVVATNGKQMSVTYIPFIHIFSHDDTLLINGAEQIKSNFSNLWSVLSPEVLGEKNLEEILVPDKKAPIIRKKPVLHEKCVKLFHDQDYIFQENQLAKYLDQMLGRYFTDIISDKELLQKCYCDFDGSHRYDKEIELVLRDRAPQMGLPIEEIETKKKGAGEFGTYFSETRLDTKLFLLVGGPGVGKTTFIHRFIQFIIPKEEQDTLIWLYLDYKALTEETNLDEFVFTQIEDQLSQKYEYLELYTNQEKLKKIFARDLSKKKALIDLLSDEKEKNKKVFEILEKLIEDKSLHIERIIHYLKNLGYATCIVYDNVDQLNADLQTKIFIHANAIRERMKTTVILSLREEIYYQHEHDKTFNFTESKLFHIPAPKVLNVLSKRMRFLKDHIDLENTLTVLNSQGALIHIKVKDIINVINQTFLGGQDNTLMLEMISNRDIRQALKIFAKLISSHNINYDPLLTAAGTYAQTQTLSRGFQNNELLRALALENRKHYSGSKSDVINAFDIENDGFYSHMTKLRILYYARSNLHLKLGSIPEGYFKLKDSYEECFKYTINNYETYLQICLSLQKVGAIVNLNGIVSSIGADDYICLGSAGNYYLTHLKGNPYYLSLAAVDTPIANKDVRDKIYELYEKSFSESDSMRKKRYQAIARNFVDYLMDTEQEEVKFLEKLGRINVEERIYHIGKEIYGSLCYFLEKN
jgi:DNA polymerase III delta prime subunit